MESEETMNRFKNFREKFLPEDNPPYISDVEECKMNQTRSLNIDLSI